MMVIRVKQMSGSHHYDMRLQNKMTRIIKIIIQIKYKKENLKNKYTIVWRFESSKRVLGITLFIFMGKLILMNARFKTTIKSFERLGIKKLLRDNRCTIF